jgi:hypothetical protein
MNTTNTLLLRNTHWLRGADNRLLQHIRLHSRPTITASRWAHVLRLFTRLQATCYGHRRCHPHQHSTRELSSTRSLAVNICHRRARACFWVHCFLLCGHCWLHESATNATRALRLPYHAQPIVPPNRHTQMQTQEVQRG